MCIYSYITVPVCGLIISNQREVLPLAEYLILLKYIIYIIYLTSYSIRNLTDG